MSDETPAVEGIAIIGMAGRFPGAQSVAEFWSNQLAGRESISHFRAEDLKTTTKIGLSDGSRTVLARSILDDVDLFDAEFFGIYPREAELMDPQQRLFLECCWQAIEDAGYVPQEYSGLIGVYAGASMGSYFFTRLCREPGFLEKFSSGYQVSNYLEMMGNSLDFLSTRVSYKLNLRGPSFTLLSACSTSLLAVTQACQALLTYQTDLALAGGASITFPQERGYHYQDGGMASADGHCRAFDADASGTVFGSGVGAVLLKRADEAIRDGDQIYAVIRGFAVNNDGLSKVGYTAPSVEGQANVIAMAQEAAGIEPDSIGYVEAHGTGTPLGDPIELAGLTKAFRAKTDRKQFCVIGTAKTNVGHLDIAAGVTGLINAAHVVRHGAFPATLHFKKPNPKFDLDNSPFRVTAERTEWPSDQSPRRAGVSAFGVGGTNAHVVIEQAPERISSQSPRPEQLLVLSARTPAALEQTTDNLAAHLKSHPNVNLADVSWTLQAGRRAFDCRRVVVASDVPDAVMALSTRDRRRSNTRLQRSATPEVYFLFPGQGSQHPNMARQIYEAEPVFREAVDRCAQILRPHLGDDLLALLYPPGSSTDETKRRVTETVIAQPAIFTIEYALAQLWMSWGIRPKAMAGHSVGEFVAACLAGVISLEDALGLIAKRGRMMQELPAGGMLSVRLSEATLRGRLREPLSLAAVNSPSLCVVAGAFEPLEQLEQMLSQEGIACRRLVTSHAFHSAMMDPLISPLTEAFANVRLNAPQIPYVSGVSGTWITADQATDPQYWARHARAAVQFSAVVTALRKNPAATLLEVGPGNVLTTLVRQHGAPSENQTAIASLSDGFSGEGDYAALMAAAGALWLAGERPDWSAFHHREKRLRLSLPTYPFERKRYWLEDFAEAAATADVSRLVSEATPIIERESQFKQGTETVSIVPNVDLVSDPEKNRASRIKTALCEMFEELSGVDISATGNAATFLELGFDSLFLTQVAQALQERFAVKVTFRQLLNDLFSLDALTEYVAGNLPPAAFGEPATNAVKTAGAPLALVPSAQAGLEQAGTASEGSLERLMREQLAAMNQLFAKQLEAVQGSAAQLGAPAIPSTGLQAVSSAKPMDAISASPTEVDKSAGGEIKAFGPYKPPQTSPTSDLTAQQEKSLNALVDRVSRRTAKSKNLTQQYRKVLADPRVVSGFRPQWKEMVYSIVTDRSKGSRIWDIDGNEYIDLVNGFGPIMLGHRPEFVEKAIEAQLRLGFETGPQTPLAGEVAQMFCEMTGNERMAFCNTGSEAVLAALRVSRTVTGRSKVVMFAGDYHGMFDEVLVKGVRNKAGEPQSTPIAPGIPKQSVSNMIVLEYGTEASLAWIRENAKDLAAVLVEPVQSRHPDMRPVEFLKEIRKISEKAGAALIFDEVVTGFRVHQGGCQALFGIRADLATYGKVVAGGMPIGVIAGKSRFMDALDGGMWQYGDESYPEVGVTFFAGTFVRHPLAVAAMKAVLQHFRDQGPELQERLNERTAKLVRTLNETVARCGLPARIESFGSFFYLAFPATERFASLFYFYMRDKGIHIREGFPCFLTTAHSEMDLEAIAKAFEESAIEMMDAGFFSRRPAAGQVGLTSADQASRDGHEIDLTEPQREILMAAMLGDEASCAYNESFSVSLQGNLQMDALRDAVNKLVTRHEILRATIDGDAGKIRINPELSLEIPLRDLSEFELDVRELELRKIHDMNARTAFSLGKGPLIRAQLVKLEPGRHLLIVTAHHLVCDGWSTNVIVDELARLYSAEVEGATAELPPAVRFSDYARDHSTQQGEGKDVEAYWINQFKSVPEPLELPTDRPRGLIRTHAGATLRSHIDAESYRKIKQLGTKNGCTMFATLLAGFFALVHRLSNQNDIVVGIPTAGQALLENSNLIGHCVNFLPLRAQLEENVSFATLLKLTKSLLLDAYDHQTYTYGTLLRKLALPRDPARTPLVEVQFNVERLGSKASFAGLQADVEPNPKAAVILDLFFNVIESDRGLVIDCDYNTDLFDESTISRWINYYETMLLNAVSDAEILVDDLSLMTPEQVSSAIASMNPDAFRSVPKSTIVHLFEERAAKTPDKEAIRMESDRLTYRELNERSNRLARMLQRRGVTSSTLVATSFERSPDMVVAMLAVLKAGAGYVPLDSSYPIERLTMLIQDADPRVVLTQEKIADRLPKSRAIVICVDSERSSIDEEDCSNLPLIARSNDTAYVIYTSGSTGKPKGVLVSHQNVVRLLKSTEEWFAFAESDVWTLFHSSSFDFSVWEIWGCLLTGGRLVVVPYLVSRSPQDFYNLLAQENVTILNQTPAAFYQLVQVEASGFIKPLALRYVIFGGESLNFANLRPWLQRHGDRSPQLVNMYGITETTVHVTYRPVTEADGQSETRSLIGRPIPDLRLYLLDSKQRPVPPGVTGEIYVGGAGVAVGYLNRPELTAERFIPDPFSRSSNGLMYRSGDLGRCLGQGEIEYIGRADSQVKVRGFRIELGEIEVAISQHSNVRQCAVVVRPDRRGSQRLAAYVVPASAAHTSGSELREFLQKKLPAHMIPNVFMEIEAIPLTLNGKVDRKRLPAPDEEIVTEGREFVAPRTEQEVTLAAILKEVLGLKRVGITDDLFELGADSLHVFQITSRAIKAGLSITPRVVLQQRSIAGIIAELKATKTSAPQVAAITPVAREKYLIRNGALVKEETAEKRHRKQGDVSG